MKKLVIATALLSSVTAYTMDRYPTLSSHLVFLRKQYPNASVEVLYSKKQALETLAFITDKGTEKVKWVALDKKSMITVLNADLELSTYETIFNENKKQYVTQNGGKHLKFDTH